MRILEGDEEAQKRGVVGCAYCVGGGVEFDLQLVRVQFHLQSALPARFDSVHLCYNDLRAHAALSLAMFSMRTHSRMRIRTHYGPDDECQRQLSSFGIPIYALPVSPRGEFNLENHWAFLATQRAIEASRTSDGKGPLGVTRKAAKKPKKKARSRQPIIEKEDVFVAAPKPDVQEPTGYKYGRLMSFSNLGFLPQPSFSIPWWGEIGAPNFLPTVPPQSQLPVPPQSHITAPTSDGSRPPAKICESPPTIPDIIYDPLLNDILMGRGKPIQQRPGNVRFREMIDKNMDKYDEGGKGARCEVAAYVLHVLKEEGSRFLKEVEDGGWVEVDEGTTRVKISHAFRTRRNMNKQATVKKGKSAT